MIRTLRILPLAAPVLLAGPAMAQTLEAGQWDSVTTVTAAEIPGMPPEMTEMMVGQAQPASTCLTAEQLADGPQALFEQNGSCDFSEFSMEGGELTMEGTCQAAGPGGGGAGEMTMSATGTYSATSYNIATTVTGQTPAGEMHVEADSVGERVGDC